MEHMGLEEDQLAKLKQFTEVTDTRDLEMAVCTLASLDWNVEQAIETHLLQEADSMQDEPEIVEEIPARPKQGVQIPVTQSGNPTEPAASSGRPRRRYRAAEEEMDYQLHDDGNDITDNNHIAVKQNGNSRRVTRSSTRNGQASSSSASSSAQSSAPSAQSAAIPARNTRSTRSNGHQTVTIDSDDDDMRIDYDDDYTDPSNDLRAYRPRNGSVPLIPDDCDNVPEALHNFATVFESKFCSTPATTAFMPQFYGHTLQEAVKEAFDAPDCSERRPLALYIHNEKSIAVNIFASQVLCTEQISSLLRHQFIFWPWDITRESNLLKLLDWLQLLNITQARNMIQKLAISKVEDFPLIMIIVREKGTFKVVDYCTGGERNEQVMGKLMQGMEIYDEIRRTETHEKREREEREQIRSQQEAEYQASLQADRARIEAKQREVDEQKAEEERKRIAEEEEAFRRQTVASLLPEEPLETETNVIQVKFRLPEGVQDMRRFRKLEKIETLINYLSSKGFAPGNYKYFNSDFPKKEITGHFDLSKTFDEVKWPAREQVFVEEI